MTGEYYTLAELSERADVPERTVRYYIQEKLIPPSLGRGRKARYGDEHLERLLEIRQLRALGLPLDVIREHMDKYETARREGRTSEAPPPESAAEGSSVEGPVTCCAVEASTGLSPPAGLDAPPSRGDAAIDYIARARAAAVTAARIPSAVGARHFALPGRGSAQSSPEMEERSRWDRISVSPDIEIHVRRPQPRSQKRALEQLVETAKELFAEEPS